jgi:hypothetical protein
VGGPPCGARKEDLVEVLPGLSSCGEGSWSGSVPLGTIVGRTECQYSLNHPKVDGTDVIPLSQVAQRGELVSTCAIGHQ